MTNKHDIIKFRRGTAAEWAASQPQPGGEVLKLGEPGYEKDTGKLKIGDGVTPWNSLDYIAAGIIVVEDVDHLINDVLQAGSGIVLNFDDSNDTLTVGVSGLINSPSNNRILTSRDTTTTNIDAESNFTFDGVRALVQCVCPSGSSGFTTVGDGKPTLIRQTCYGNPEEIITDDGTIINRPINRQIFFSARGSSSSPSGLIVDDSIFILRGDAYNHYGTLNANGNLDHRAIRIRGYVSNSGTFYDGSSLSFETSSGGNTAYDNLMTFDHNGTLSVGNAITVNNLKLDGNTLSSTNNNGNIIIQPSGTGALQRDSGGNTRGQYAVDWQAVRPNDTMVAAGNYSVIGGGNYNTIAISGANSTIGGGSLNTISGYCNTISGGRGNTSSNLYSTVGGGTNNTTNNDYSTVGGGVSNISAGIGSTVAGGGWYNANTYQFEGNYAIGDISTIGGGANNSASGYASTIGGGTSNYIDSSIFGTVGGGSSNAVLGFGSVVGGGRDNTSSNHYSTIPGGYSAKATRYGELSHAAGRFTSNGDAQHTILIARKTTADATANQVLFLDDSLAQLTIPAETTWAFTIKLSAYNDTDNQGGWWIFRGGIRRNATNDTALIGSLITESGTESSLSTASASVVADDTDEALEIRVTGVASKNIRWVAVVDISQVSYGTP